MKLSEAIRLGSMLGPQSYRSLETRRRKYILFGPYVNHYCALGAAFKAVGATEKIVTLEQDEVSHGGFRGASTIKRKAGTKVSYVQHPWSDLTWLNATCPQCEHADVIHRLIPHMNDKHRMTREAIADFVEQIERAQEPTFQPTPVAVLAE